jgi:Domain of unknown function (DUF5753)/Helix-turn-helix domain
MATETASGSGVPRRVLGRALRGLRLETGLTTRVAAELLEWSEPKLWRVETGQTALRGLDVTVMCEVYRAPPAVAAALAALAREARHAPSGGWWHDTSDGGPGVDVYGVLEEEACLLQAYASCQVPALLQTGAYAAALIMAGQPGLGADDVGRLVRRRLDRQVLITRETAPLEISVILSEALLHRTADGAAVMAGQLRHLAGITALPNVKVRVAPFSAGMHLGMLAGPFTLLRFPHREHGGHPDTVRWASLTGELYLDQPAQVQRYREAHAATLACSLSGDASQDLLLAVAKELER